MEATNKVGMISKRIVLVSAIMLVAASASANTLEAVLSATKGSLLIFYIIGGMFFAGFIIHFMGSRLTKRSHDRMLRPATGPTPVRRHHNHYRRVIKKTA